MAEEDKQGNNIKINDAAVDAGDMMGSSNRSDDAVITGFGLTGGIVPSAVSDEKSPSLSDDDKEQLGKGDEKNRIYCVFFVFFLNESLLGV